MDTLLDPTSVLGLECYVQSLRRAKTRDDKHFLSFSSCNKIDFQCQMLFFAYDEEEDIISSFFFSELNLKALM